MPCRPSGALFRPNASPSSGPLTEYPGPRSALAWLRWALALGFGLALVACSPAGAPPTGVKVVHLEPLQWSGGVASARLSSEVVFREHLDPIAEGAFVNCEVVRPAVGKFAPAVRVDRERITEVGGWVSKELAWPARLDWFVWVEVEGRPKETLSLHWEPVGSAGDAFPKGFASVGYIERTWQDENGRQRSKLSFRVQPNADVWSQGPGRFAIRLPAKCAQLRILNIVVEGRPLSAEASPARDAEGLLDTGLWTTAVEHEDATQVRYESRRSYPAFAGEVMIADYVAGGRPRLNVGCAMPPMRALEGAVSFEIRARKHSTEDPTTAGRRLKRIRLDGRRNGRPWATLAVDLPGREGERWQVILDVQWSGPEGTVAGLWGNPTIDYQAAKDQPSALVITADTLRADHLAAYRDSHGLGGQLGLETPNLDGLVERGVLFSDALSASNATGPSHVSLFTSLPLRDHGILRNGHALPEGHQTLAEVFREGGWNTLHLAAARHLNPELSGLGQGVDQYLEMPEVSVASPSLDTSGSREKLHPVAQRGLYHSSAEYGTPRFLEAVDELNGSPFYAWYHTFDPHTPYLPPSSLLNELGLKDDASGRPLIEVLADRHTERPGDVGYFVRETPLVFLGHIRSEAYAKALYAASVTHMDRSLGELFDGLDERGRLEDTLIVFTSDHGESLGERDSWFDHRGVYGATLRVPLVFAGAGVAPGHVIDEGVSTLDVYPTLAEWFGLGTPEYISGRSLAATLRDPEAAPPQPIRRWFEHAGQTQVGFAEDNQLFVLTLRDQASSSFGDLRTRGTAELLEATADLEEPEPALTAEDPQLEQRILSARDWIFDRQVEIATESTAVSAEEQAVLEALGYKD